MKIHLGCDIILNKLRALSVLVWFQSFASEMNSLVALHEVYKYINKYYDQVSDIAPRKHTI